MDLEYGPQYDEFRKEVVNFIKENEHTKSVSYTHLTLPTNA